MPAPATYGYRCWQCPIGPGLRPRLVNGHATPGDAYRAFLRHQLFEHPAGEIDWSSIGGR